MDATKTEALMTARRLVRMLESAPNPLQQARTAVTTLVRAQGWRPADEKAILEVAAWLSLRPPMEAIKPRCQALLRRLV